MKKLISSGVGILLLISPVAAWADVASEIEALKLQIAQLTQLLSQLIAQKNLTIAALTLCFVPTFDLYIGRTDAQTNGEVTRLQDFLAREGYFGNPNDQTGLSLQPTGYYGEKTAAAVVKWQKAHGMDFVTLKSGVGKMTRAKMVERCAVSPSVAPNSNLAKYSEIREAQFEGTYRLRFEFLYPPQEFTVSREQSGLTITEKATGTVHTVQYAWEGGRGYTLDEWWNMQLRTHCPSCVLVPNPVTLGAAPMRTYANDTMEVILIGGPNAFTFAFVLHKPAQKMEQLISTITMTML